MNTNLLTIRMQLWRNRFLYIPGRMLAIFILLIILVTPALLNPEQIPLPNCYFKSITGYSCPTCGLTHAFHEISHLNLKSSFSHHLFGPVLYVLMLLLLVKLTVESTTGINMGIKVSSRVKKWTIFLFALCWMSFWLVRFILELQV